MKHNGGRPSKLTPEVQERIVSVIRVGNYIETAAALAGVSKNTLYDWLKRGARERERVEGNGRHRIQKEEQDYVEFSDAVEEALAESEAHDLEVINKAAFGYAVLKTKEVVQKDGTIVELTERSHEFDWRAASWRLERKFSDRWGPKSKQEITGADGGAVTIKVVYDDDEVSR